VPTVGVHPYNRNACWTHWTLDAPLKLVKIDPQALYNGLSKRAVGEEDAVSMTAALDEITTQEQFMTALRALMDTPKKRTVAGVVTRSLQQGHSISRSTVYNIIGGRPPSPEKITAFLYACDVPEAEHDAWLRTYNRLRESPTTKHAPDVPKVVGTDLGSNRLLVRNSKAVLVVGGQPRISVEVPRDAAGAEDLLFGPRIHAGSSLVGSWLRPTAGVIRPEPRPELDAILSWLSAGNGPVLRLVCGIGGQGKTFLARLACRTLADDGWIAGFVALPPLRWRSQTLANLGVAESARWERSLRRMPEIVAGIYALAETRQPALLVVDYAENSVPIIEELLDVIAEARAQDNVRILLLARSSGEWWRKLSREHHRHDWIDPSVTRLGSLTRGMEPERVAEIWLGAVEAFSVAARRHGREVNDTTKEGPPASAPTTLDLYAHALLHVLETSPTSSTTPDGDPIARVLQHENRQITARMHAEGMDLTGRQQDLAAVMTSLRPAPTLAAAVVALDSAPELAHVDTGRLSEILAELYPDETGKQVWSAPRPDRLADTRILELASSARSDADWHASLSAMVGTEEADVAQQAATVLLRSLSTPDPQGVRTVGQQRIRASLDRLVRDFPGGYVPPLLLAEPVVVPDALVTAIADQRVNAEDLRRVRHHFDCLYVTMPRTHVAVAVARRLVHEHRANPKADVAVRRAYAKDLSSLSHRLQMIRRPKEASTAIEEAAAVYRELAAGDLGLNDDRDFNAEYASVLHAAAGLLDGYGRRAEALTAAEEAVHRWRMWSGEREFSLARSLYTYAAMLDREDRTDEAVAAIQEAVPIFKGENMTLEAAGAQKLASTVLAKIGRTEASLAALDEAIASYRSRDSAGNPHSRELADCLHDRCIRLPAERAEEALEAIEEAVSLYRSMPDRPDRTLWLADGLFHIFEQLESLHRTTEAREALTEAMHLFRGLAHGEMVAPVTDLLLRDCERHAARKRFNEALIIVDNVILILGDNAGSEAISAALSRASSLRAEIIDSRNRAGETLGEGD
jgi:tetratricopeptide (TPR) repeat protein